MYKKRATDFINSTDSRESAESAALRIAYKKLAQQIEDNEKHAAELVIANAELLFQNSEKEKRATELALINIELAFQYSEKEKRAAELLITNKELESFAFISSHDLQEPLRKIQVFSSRILEEEEDLTEKGKYHFERICHAALRMQTLIEDLLTYSMTTGSESVFENSDLNLIIREVMEILNEEILERKAVIELINLGEANIIPFQFKQLLQNLITNSLKFKKPDINPHIIIKGTLIRYDDSMTFLKVPTDHYHIEFSDNGIGFEPGYQDKIFELFQKLHKREDFEGTGIGLTIVKKIVNNHNGVITAHSKPNEGARFDIYIPA